MNRKKFFILSIVLVFMIINLFNLLKISNLKTQIQDLTRSLNNTSNTDSVTIAILLSNQRLLSQNSYFKISRSLKLSKENGEEVVLSKLLDNEYKIVFRYSEFTCMDCIRKEMGNMKALSEKIGKNNILVLASFDNQRDFYINKRVNNIDLPIYNIPLKSLDNTIENFNIPYIFILDKDCSVSNIFLPYRDMPHLTEEYFKDIIKFFEKS